ncbi:F-box domain-containing protein [Favolaschia claudopus]|uniref:F-box domain-containing protein n=1 Tax=Favolaschia claudopus TaxID=2862362 RepID=A0AAW0EHD1_9AGAR
MPVTNHNEENTPPVLQPAKKKLKRESSVRDKTKDMNASKVPKYAKTKAKLSLLPSLPLDVLFEIFGHLPPVDILHLARTTKGFRSILLHKSASSTWKTSLRRVPGLPECPEDMSQPAWVNLVYSAHCHNCFENKVLKVDWLLRLRLCEVCLKSYGHVLLQGDQHLDSEKKIDQIVLKCIPFSTVYRVPCYKGRYCSAVEEENFLKDLKAAEDRSAFVKTRQEALVARKIHGTSCQMWSDSLTQERWDELADIREKRRADITEKLETLGFIEELEYLEGLPGDWLVRPPLQQFKDHPDVKSSKPLTPRNWKNIESRLIEYMHKVKAHRLAAERLAVVRAREKIAISAWVQFRMRYAPEKLLPSGIEMLSWHKVKAILELPSSVPSSNKDRDAIATPSVDAIAENDTKTLLEPSSIYPSTFTRIFESMRAGLAEWEEEKITELGREAPIGRPLWFREPSSSEYLKNLQLAVCVFSCEDTLNIHQLYPHHNNTYPAMWYPEFLHHPCNTVTKKDPFGDDVPENKLFLAPKEIGWRYRRKWSCETIFFDSKASRAVERVLEACGLNPDSTTTQKMDEMDPRFICLKCSYGAKCDGQRNRKVMSWRAAVQHCMKVHWGDAAVTWERVMDSCAVEARTLSASRALGSSLWRCGHCRDSRLERDGKSSEQLVQEHLDDVHNVEEPVKGKHYFLAVDFPPPAIPVVQIVPKEVVVGRQ